MTPQVAVGTGLGGLAAAGVGGSAIAYAAGAFEGKEKKTDENTIKTYFTEAKKDNTNANKKYIGGDGQDVKVKKWLKESDKEKQYKKDLGDNLGSMELSGSASNDKPTEEMINNLKTPNKLDESAATKIYDFTHKWCEAKKGLTYDVNSTTEFDIFKKVCFVNDVDS
ncbi:hypothetical protein [Candidatus Mycoplasma haematohominis]|uniref:Uncharacterized protein n=1 Tax=Candidatus Mycoplasma haematohominis TaxID=1494318 RepID=A0A478FP44_9MOLU|nr:hypothetical protein [Candidatus Mycoplasma haemohominis]GCE63088.1 hypothetical protein MHSWG343_00660 [Candidatus Mycoplasma haemohominis]